MYFDSTNPTLSIEKAEIEFKNKLSIIREELSKVESEANSKKEIIVKERISIEQQNTNMLNLIKPLQDTINELENENRVLLLLLIIRNIQLN